MSVLFVSVIILQVLQLELHLYVQQIQIIMEITNHLKDDRSKEKMPYSFLKLKLETICNAGAMVNFGNNCWI